MLLYLKSYLDLLFNNFDENIMPFIIDIKAFTSVEESVGKDMKRNHDIVWSNLDE